MLGKVESHPGDLVGHGRGGHEGPHREQLVVACQQRLGTDSSLKILKIPLLCATPGLLTPSSPGHSPGAGRCRGWR